MKDKGTLRGIAFGDRPPTRGQRVPYCPMCGAVMVKRIPKAGAYKKFKPFWGCIQYPDCKGMRDLFGQAGADDEWWYVEGELE